jgi:hypothetical protein|tara:strand:+ start:811 stop:996 length:186 start_codon:yes stop_codon:yes gene_type:complete
MKNLWKKFVDFVTGTERLVVRARNDKGHYVADDKSTDGVNEAYKEVRVKKRRGRPKQNVNR